MKKPIIYTGILVAVIGTFYFIYKTKKNKISIPELQLNKINNEILHSQVSPYDDEKMWF